MATPRHPAAMTRRLAKPPVVFDTDKFENVQQIGGIQTAMLESPTGSGQMRRVAQFRTGSGLQFTVALDRGGDIVDAFFNQHSLAFLSLNGIKAPSHAYHTGMEWLYGWPGGLLTSCGPKFMGAPREEDDEQVNLHGHHSNLPASVEMLINPDPHRGRHEMLMTFTVRDSCMFAPCMEVRRTILCTLGVPEIRLFDEITNRGNVRSPHHWLYHINLGYPLVDRGSQLIFKGKTQYVERLVTPRRLPTDTQLNRMKRVTGTQKEHVGAGERCLIVELEPDRRGDAHAGIINRKLGIGFELVFPVAALPRLTNWQHFGPRGCYVTAVEPFSGSLLGKAVDDYTQAEQYLAPGQTKRYQMTLKVHHTASALNQFAKRDGKVYL